MYGQYEVVERIAVGGMAEIYLGVSRGAEGFIRPVVIKKVRPYLSADDRFVHMLIKEAKITAGLNHPNIVQILDLGQNEQDEYFIVMEYVEGHDLRSVMDQSAMRGVEIDRNLAMYIAGEVCAALDHAHRKTDDQGRPLRLIHRDVSPSNILISYAGEVKLTDFGIARYGRDVSVVGSLKGKLAYMSPEQARGRPIDRRTDIFSLGSILFELLFGRKVFLADNDLDLLEQVRVASIPLPSSVDPTVPLELEQLLLRSLSPNPESRFPTAEALQMALREFQFHHVSQRVGAQDLSDLLEELFPMRRKPLPPVTVPKFRVATMASFHVRTVQRMATHEETTPVGQIPPDLLRRTVEPSQEWLVEPSSQPLPEEPPAIPPDADAAGLGEFTPAGAVPVKAAPVEAPDVGWRRKVASAPPKGTATFSGHLHLLQLVTAIQTPLAEEPSLEPLDDDDDDRGPPTRAASPAALGMLAPARAADGGATEESLPAILPEAAREPEPLLPPREPTPARPETSDMVPLPARFSRSAPRASGSTAPRRSWVAWLLVALLGSALGSGVAFLLVWPHGDPDRTDHARSDARAAPRPDLRLPDAPSDRSAGGGKARDAAAAPATPDVKPRSKRRGPRVKGRPKVSLMGQVVIKSEPWAYVYVDGKSTGLTTSATPFRLPVGTHQVELVNPKLSLRKSLTITVTPDGVSRTFVRLAE